MNDLARVLRRDGTPPGAKIEESLRQELTFMLWTILVILLVLWLLGFLTSVGGGLIHLLLVVAAIVLVVQLLSGRRVA